ncbi:MAG: YesL family protein, partial [Candidatus Limivicinus sp.]
MSEKNKLASSLGLFLRRMFDLMVLNVLWLLCCLPVFTFGPASSALARVMITLVRGGSEAVAKNYFLAFRRDFGRAVVLGLIGLAGLAIAVSDILFAISLSGGMRIIFLIVAVLVSSLVFSYLAYVFALHAFFENSVVGQIRNALSLAAAAPMETLTIWLCFALPVAAFLLLPRIVMIYIGFLYILFGVSCPAYFAAKHQAKVIARFDGTQPP